MPTVKTMIKITKDFLTQNKFQLMNQHDNSFIRTDNNGVDIIVNVNDSLSHTFLNGVYLKNINAIKLNQLWILLTNRKENWFNYPIPCSLCGTIPERYNEQKTLGGELLVGTVIKCEGCGKRVFGSDDKVSLTAWNLSSMGVFSD